MLSFEERLQTFAEWPKNFATKPQALAEAGFTYAGPSGKKHMVHCAECNCIIYKNSDEVDPWQFHASRYPPCSWVVAEKGDDFVANCQRMFGRRKGWRGSFSIPELQALCEAAGLYLDYDELFKDCMPYQRCVDEMIWRLEKVKLEYIDKMALTTDQKLTLYSHVGSVKGITGKPTMAKCRKAKTDFEKWGKWVQIHLVDDEQRMKDPYKLARRKRFIMRYEQNQGGQERKQGEQERKQGEQESEQGGQESEQGGQESEQGGQESEQGGQESEPIRKEGKQRGRKRQANRTNTFQAKKSCPDPKTPKPSDCGHCGAKTDQPNPVQNIFVLDADGYREAVRDSLVTNVNNTVQKRVTDQIPAVPDKKAKCDKCEKSFTRWDNLKKHIAAKHEYPKTCENCNESFDNQSSLSKHQNTCGQSTSAKSNPVFNCPQCSKSYFNESFLQNHINIEHERKQNNICLTCGEIFTSVSSCKKHKETCGNNATSVTDGDKGLAQGNANLRGKGKAASAKPPQNSQGTSSSSSRSPCKLCLEEPVDIATHYLDHHNIRDPSSMLVTDSTFLIPTGGNQHCDSVWFSIQFAKAMERYTDTVCRLCDRDLRHQLKSLGLDDLEVHYIGDHKVNRKFLSATKRLIREDGV